MNRLVYWVPGTIGVILLAFVMVFTLGGLTKPQSTTITKSTAGGLWMSPYNNETITGPIHFTARAYRASRTEAPISYVQFTISWQGRPGPWVVACGVKTPTHTDLYECDFDPRTSAEPIPAGQLNISFDVYDAENRVKQAPHGTRKITYQP